MPVKDAGSDIADSDIAGSDVVTELDVAESVRNKKSPSPSRFNNMWLFDVRITGTGISYRASLDEYVYRPPELYLNDDFLTRCQGLPVIFMHPEDSMLNTDEYRDRNIGSIMLVYIPESDDGIHRRTDVWGIARIYDADAVELMQTRFCSTSPAVSLPEEGSRFIKTRDGKPLLIENEPQVFDHLAIVDVGVWDKGEASSGIRLD